MASAAESSPALPTGLSRTGIIRWWESRRIRFNIFVGSAGLISIVLVLVAGSAAVKPGTDFVEPLGLILFPVVFGIASNLCYTAGWIIDIVLFCSAPRLRLFRTGLIASTALASQPGLWAVIAWMITIYTGHKLE
jgi:hypothetical protein